MPPVTRNPATGQTVYTDEQLAWLKVIDRCRRLSGKPCLGLKEAFRVAYSLGYRKVEPERPLSRRK